MSHCQPQSFVVRCLLLIALCAFLFASASAQNATATLSGTVVDPNGAVVPGANITLTEVATGIQRTVTTNDQGYFTIPLLKPSTYAMLVAHEGFTTAELRDVVLNVGDQKALRIMLKTGDIKETVNISDETPLVNESPAVGTVIDRQFVGNLPLNGRSFQTLIALTPGVVVAKTTSNVPGQFSVNGQRTNANYFTIDGVSANFSGGLRGGQASGGELPALAVTGGTNNLVSVDALQEFRIQTSTYAPEFGRTPGAQVQIVTRSGANDFHGSVFDYFRNDVLDANDWFANANRLRKPKERQNDFGGVFGGPIIKNRTFFFFSYEGLRLRQPLVGVTEVPSLVSRQSADSLIKPLFDAFPIPNGPVTANGFAQFSASFSNPTQLDATSIRIDQTVNSKLAIFGRYNYSPSSLVERASSGTTLNTVGPQSFKTQTLTIGLTQFISSAISNEFRANYSQDRQVNTFELDNFGGAVPPPQAVLFPPGFSAPETSSATFSIVGGLNTLMLAGFNRGGLQRQVNLVDNLRWALARHQLKFGVDYRNLRPRYDPLHYGFFLRFSSISSALSKVLSFTGNSVLDKIGYSFHNLSVYGQDTWNISPRLTLTYGLRWELNPPPSIVDAPRPIVIQGINNPSTASVAPSGTPLWKTTHNNFAPRVGISYQLSQASGRETVVRGGFGIFYDLGSGSAGEIKINYPYSRSVFLFGVPYPLTPSQLAPAPFNTTPPFTGQQLLVFDPNLKLPYTMQWNLSGERAFGSKQSLSVTYVGALGRRLLRRNVLTNVNPILGTLVATFSDKTSDYHALQLEFQRRLSHGLQALGSYTWAHSIDETSQDSVETDQARGPSDYDIRHTFTAAVTYNIPTPGVGSVGRAFLHNWSVDTLATARSATPVNLTAGLITLNGFRNILRRPDLVEGLPIYLHDRTVPGGMRFNRDAFVIPTGTRQGSLGRNALRGFGVWQMDLALRREFSLKERLRLQWRAEVFNIFNHPNFAAPTNSLTSGLFGRSTQMYGRSLGSGGLSGGFNPLYQVGGPRSIQFALKVLF